MLHVNAVAGDDPLRTSPEIRMIFLPDAEDRTIVSSFIRTKHWNVTDGRTEFLWLLQRSALPATRTRRKNGP